MPGLVAYLKARFHLRRRSPADLQQAVRYFEDAIGALPNADAEGARLVANWMHGELAAALHRAGTEIGDSPVAAPTLAQLIARVRDGTLSGKMAKDVFDAAWNGEGSVDAIIEARGLKQISDSGAIERIVDDVLAANAAIVAEFRAGKDKAFNALVGKAMAATRGKANPAQVNSILKQKLGGQPG